MTRILWVSLLMLTLIPCAQGANEVHSLEVQAGKSLRSNCPIWIDLPKGFQKGAKFVLTDVSTGKRVACQTSETGKQLVFILPGELAGNASLKLELSIGNQEQLPLVQCLKEEGTVALGFEDQKVLSYHTAIVSPPEGKSELYQRSGHIHPFLTPLGKVVTDPFPDDHMHQHGIFAAWTKTFFEGKQIDFWNQLAGTGTVLHRDVLETVSGPVFASFQVRLMHRVLGDSPRDVVDETWIVRLYNIKDVHIFDLESVQTCVSESPLTLAEYHYGGFAFRGSGEWIKKGSHRIITNETEDRNTGNHTRPDWVSIYGEVDGSVCGAAMFSHPGNFRSPQPVRLHPTMPYFVYSPCVLGEFDLKPGEPYRTMHRYIAFDESPDQNLLNSLWNDYSRPPVIRWSATPKD